MRKKNRISLLILTLAICTANVSGCKSIFIQKETQPNSIQTIDKTKLSNNNYYIYNEKNNTYETFFTEGITFSSSTYNSDPTRVIWEIDRDHMIPTVDAGCSLIYVNSKDIPDKFTLERFIDVGYTIGLRNIYYDEKKGYICFPAINTNYKTGSDMLAKGLKAGLDDKQITAILLTINGKEITEDMLTPCGSFPELDKGKSYDLEVYKGTQYMKLSIIADTRIFYSSEAYSLTEYDLTQDGYIKIVLPDNLEKGYYSIGNSGLFYYEAGVDAKNNTEDTSTKEAVHE